MTKAELIERVYGHKEIPRDLTKKTVIQIVDLVFTEMGDYFIRSKVTRKQAAKLTYPGFGTFSKRRRNERVVKNPKTREPSRSRARDRDVLPRPGAALAAQPQRQSGQGKSRPSPPRARRVAARSLSANT